MNLNELANQVAEERAEFETRLGIIARSLTFREVVSTIRFNPEEEGYSRFKPGEELSFLVCQGWVNVRVNPEYLTVMAQNTEVTFFRGEEVARYYQELANAIERAQRGVSEDLRV